MVGLTDRCGTGTSCCQTYPTSCQTYLKVWQHQRNGSVNL